MDRPNGGFRREYSQGNGVQQAPTDRSQPDRQEEEWSMPANVDRREDTERHETSQVPPPNVPPPTEERLFTDWSSMDSLREGVSQCIQSARSVEPNITQTVVQTEQPAIDPAGHEVIDNTLGDVMTISSAHQQLSQVSTRYVDRETNTSEVEVGLQREETRMDIIQSHSRGVQVPTSHSDLSFHDTDIIGGSPARPHVDDIMPQLDGPVSVCTRRRRREQECVQRITTMPKGGYPNESDSDPHDNRRSQDE